MNSSSRKDKIKDSVATQAAMPSWKQSVWLPALVSTLLLIAAFPPLSFYPCAWLATIGWLIVSDRSMPVGRKGYFQLWLSGVAFWLVQLHSVRLAFWPLYAGWIALACYLAIYVPLMVGATRVMLHRWRLPLALSAPIAWAGTEMLRSHLLTGYSANTLAHSQAWDPHLIQIVDTVGHGGLSFLIVAVAAMILRAAQTLVHRVETSDGKSRSVRAGVGHLLAAAFVIGAIWSYGAWRLAQADKLYAASQPLLRCLLLQENTPTIFEMNPNYDESRDRVREAWTSYINLCRSAVQQADSKLDLVVWPESTFTAYEPVNTIEFDAEGQLPKWLVAEMQQYGYSRSDFEDNLDRSRLNLDLKIKVALLASRGLDPLADLPTDDGPDLLVGCDEARFGPDRLRRHAGAMWVGADGKIMGNYAKMHLVMFGEYIPWKPVLGWLENVFGFAGSDPGDAPQVFDIHGVRVSPNICFETMVPRLIQWQVLELSKAGQPPQLLVNLTNDSWFKGTSMLDHHLASSILCCVENRRPMVVAANTGLSAEIDGCGRLVQCSQRLTVEAIVAEPHDDRRWGLVQLVGYPGAWFCAIVSVLALGSGFLRRP